MSKNIFIHFLNRELYRSVGVNKIVDINYVFKILILCCGKTFFVPLSSIWESFYVNDLDYDFLYLIYEKGEIEICSDCITIEEFLYRNKTIYAFDKERYKDIYFCIYKKIKKFVPTKIKPIGATEQLSNKINNWDINIRLNPKDKVILEKNKSVIKVVNCERENEALTLSLFQDKLLRKEDHYSVARFLSATYIEDYCQWLDANIITGINNYLQYYDQMSKEYPYYDIRLYKFILWTAGVSEEIIRRTDYNFWNKIIERRAIFSMETIYDLINRIIDSSINLLKLHNYDIISLRNVCKCVKIYTLNTQIKTIKERQADKFIYVLEENLKKIYKKINKSIESEEKDSNSFFKNSNPHKSVKDIFENVLYDRSINIYRNRRNLMKIFIVHGHDNKIKLELKNYIQNTLHLGEPIILSEQSSNGLTIIEKFEKYAMNSNLVFVLLTPDDIYGTENRSRQNVIFEMGYFLGKLGRKSGRVILLYKGELDVPNDISGLIYIKIDNGIEAAGEEIRREISGII